MRSLNFRKKHLEYPHQGKQEHLSCHILKIATNIFTDASVFSLINGVVIFIYFNRKRFYAVTVFSIKLNYRFYFYNFLCINYSIIIAFN